MNRHVAERTAAAQAFQRRKLERLLQSDDLSLVEVARVIEGIPPLRDAVLKRAGFAGTRPALLVESLRRVGLASVVPLLR